MGILILENETSIYFILLIVIAKSGFMEHMVIVLIRKLFLGFRICFIVIFGAYGS